LCGQISYEVDALDSPIGHCACHTCRKAHAAAFNTSAGVKQEHFRWLAGEEGLRFFESSPGKRRYFCGHCGTHVIAQHTGSTRVILRVATLDDDPGQRPQSMIWASHQVPWLDCGDDLPRHAEWQPEHVKPKG
jgi:ADP-ribosyl-[dinitrogen reductase] hydrolase